MSTSIGIDIGGTNIKSLLLTNDNKTEQKEVHPTPSNLEELLEVVVGIVKKLTINTEVNIGIGCAGWVQESGNILSSPNITYLNGVNLLNQLKEELDQEELASPNLIIQNDVVAATLAQLLDPANSFEDFIFVAFGTGLGSSRVINGKIFSGANNFWGEVGHTFITERDLPECGCGRSGCFEQMASGVALSRMTTEIFGKSLSGEEVSQYIQDPEADSELKRKSLELAEELSLWMGRGVNNLINICDPKAVILGGGLMNLGGANYSLLESIKSKIPTQIPSYCQIEQAKDLDFLGATGVAHLANI